MSFLEKYKQTKWHLGWVKFFNDLKPMTWLQRLEYIWMYYKEIMAIIALVGLAFALVVTVISHRMKEPLVSGMIVNLSVKQEGYNYMQTDYLEALAPGEKNKVVELDYTSFGSLEDAENGEINYNASMMLIARVTGQMLDYALLDKFAMEYYIGRDVYLDLREFFTEAELQELDAANRVIYLQVEETGDRWPVAIDISEIPFIKDNVTSKGPVYFILSGNVRNLEMCRNAWDRLHAWKSKPAA